MNELFNKISKNPIIAAVKDLEQLDMALDSACEVIFLLTGNIFNLREISNRVFKKDKCLYIYVDAIDGFSKDTWGLEYIIKNIPLNGIITSKPNIVKQSKDMGVFTIHRVIVSDTSALRDVLDSIRYNRPHGVQILPGIMPRIISTIVDKTKIPLITGGLILDGEDVKTSLDAGAIAVSTSNVDIWY